MKIARLIISNCKDGLFKKLALNAKRMNAWIWKNVPDAKYA